MADEPAQSITIEPVVSYPRSARPGARYYLTVEVQHRHPPEQWPYAQEELTLTCLLETSLFWHEPLGDQKIVLHRFGGSYGPTAFLLTAREKLQKGGMTLSLVNRYGVTVHTIVLRDIEIVETPAPGHEPAIDIPLPEEVAFEGEEVVQETAEPPSEEPSTEWISFSNSVPPEVAQQLERTLVPFRDFLLRLGFMDEDAPPLHLEADHGRISDLVRREYALHALRTSRRFMEGVRASLKLGLANYLVCSFNDAPVLRGKDTRAILLAGQRLPHQIQNSLSFEKGLSDEALADSHSLPSDSEVKTWGGVFWELREALGADFLDSILSRTWRTPGINFILVFLDLVGQQSLEAIELVCEILLDRGVINLERQHVMLMASMRAQRHALSHPILDRPEVEQILSLLLSPKAPPLLYLEAHSGQGASTLMKLVGQRLEHLPPPNYFIKVQATLDPAHRFPRTSRLSSFKARIHRVREDVIRHQPRGLAVVAIDLAPWDLSTPNLRLLQELISHRIRAIVLTRPGTHIPLEGPTLQLKDLDAQQMMHLARLHEVGLSEEGARELVEWTGGSIRLATTALRSAHKQRWPLEELMRFEGEDWSRIFDVDLASARVWLHREPSLERALAMVIDADRITLDEELALPLEGMGLIRRRKDKTWSLRAPVYSRILAPHRVLRLHRSFRNRVSPHLWTLQAHSRPHREKSWEIELTLESKLPSFDPVHGPVRFRLTPELETIVKPRKGRASATFVIPEMPFGPTTAYAEIDGGKFLLSLAIDRIEGASSPPPDSPRTPPSKLSSGHSKQKLSQRRRKVLK